MSMEVTVVRIYLHESKGQLTEFFRYLHDESRVRGVTVFRGITGFGISGKIHSSSLIDMTLDLPVVIEFFDEPEKVNTIIEHLKTRLKPGHILYWTAQLNI